MQFSNNNNKNIIRYSPVWLIGTRGRLRRRRRRRWQPRRYRRRVDSRSDDDPAAAAAAAAQQQRRRWWLTRFAVACGGGGGGCGARGRVSSWPWAAVVRTVVPLVCYVVIYYILYNKIYYILTERLPQRPTAARFDRAPWGTTGAFAKRSLVPFFRRRRWCVPVHAPAVDPLFDSTLPPSHRHAVSGSPGGTLSSRRSRDDRAGGGGGGDLLRARRLILRPPPPPPWAHTNASRAYIMSYADIL